MLPVVVEQVRPQVTYDLRARVLRPGRAPFAARFDGDEAPDALHYAAYDRADRIVGVVAVLPEAMPESEPGEPAGLGEPAGPREPAGPGRRLRGMAVHPDERGEGVGTALLVRVFDGVARLGGGLLWCNARLPAAGFYEQAGFVRHGEPWDEPDLGPHVRMWRQVGVDELIEPADG